MKEGRNQVVYGEELRKVGRDYKRMVHNSDYYNYYLTKSVVIFSISLASIRFQRCHPVMQYNYISITYSFWSSCIHGHSGSILLIGLFQTEFIPSVIR